MRTALILRCQAIAAATVLMVTPLRAVAAEQPDRSTAAAPAFDYARLDEIFAQFQRDKHIPGMVYGVVADGRLIHLRTFGVQDLASKRPVTQDSLFRIASMTKSFTALAILALRDQGRLRLDEPAETYVPELRSWRYPTADSPRIRVRDLLHHTAGFVTDDPWGDRQTPMPEAEFTRLLRTGVPFSSPPGLRMEYSNFGYAMLGRIVSNVSGMPYRTFVERMLLQPLGMTSSGFEVAESPKERRALGYRWENDAWSEEPTMRHGAFGAMGGLQTSARDYARYVAWLLSAWPARDDPEVGAVRRSTIRQLGEGSGFASVRKRMIGNRSCEQAVHYGMGMRVFADCSLGTALNHGGGYPGYGSGVLLLPEYGVGLFVFSNRTYAGGSDALWSAASMLQAAGLLKERPPVVSPHLAQAYAAVRTIYRTGDVLAARDSLAGNFLMDRSAANWRTILGEVKSKAGACTDEKPPLPRGALAADFRWQCERAVVEGSVLLAPTAPATIQALQLTVSDQVP